MKQLKALFKSPFIYNQFVILLFCILECVLCEVSVAKGMFYYAFQLWCICAPGSAILSFVRKRSLLFEDTELFVYVFGLMYLMAEYFLLITVKGLLPLWLVALLSPLPSVFYILKHGHPFSEEGHLSHLPFFVLWIVLTVICFFAVSYHIVLPDRFGAAIYDKDFLFWVGNSVSFTKGFPANNFRLVGEIFYYHYFSNLIVAATNMVTGIDVMTISCYFSYIIPCLLLVYGCKYFLGSVIRSTALIIFGTIFILLINGSTSYLPEHLYYCPFGFDYGYAFAMIMAGHLIKMYQQKEQSSSDLLLSCFFIMAGTGFKGPIALVALMNHGIIALSLLIHKQWKKGIVYGLLWFMSFVLVYVLVISGIKINAERTNGLLFLGPLGAFDRNSWAIEILQELMEVHGFANNGLTRILALILYVYRNNKAAMLLLGVGILALMVKTISRKRHDSTLEIMLICASLWGIGLTINTFQDGNSQMYFIMSAFPFAVLTGLYALHEISNISIKTIIVFLIFAVSFGDLRSFFTDSVKTKVEESFKVQQGGLVAEDKRYYFTEEEYHLATWLKKNTDADCLVALDCFEYDGYRKEEMLGVFSERFVWDDGLYSNEKERERRRELTEKAVKGNKEALIQLKSENVSYLIQTLSQNPSKIIDEEIIYEQNGFVIYRLS